MSQMKGFTADILQILSTTYSIAQLPQTYTGQQPQNRANQHHIQNWDMDASIRVFDHLFYSKLNRVRTYCPTFPKWI